MGKFLSTLAALERARPVEPAPASDGTPKEGAHARIAKLVASSKSVDTRFEGPVSGHAVPNSEDLERILALPRRPIPEEGTPEADRLVREMTSRLSNGVRRGQGCRCAELNPAMRGHPAGPCITELRFIQAWYLHEAAEMQGALGPIAVGAGKTGIDVLTAMVVPGCRQAVLLLPPTLKPQFLADFELWRQHFKVPNLVGASEPTIPGRPVLRVLKYSELSAPGFATWLTAHEPQVIIADEAQALKDRKATRVVRFLRYFVEQGRHGKDTRFFCHTGSLTTKGLEDYSHLSALALREGSPVPHDPHQVSMWGEALNPTRYGDRADPGALMKLCAPGETVEQGFRRRFLETRGVVATFEGSLAGVRLEIRERVPPPMPPEVADALALVRNRKRRPDGEELQDALEVSAVAREVACGFYMYWNFPGASAEDFERGGRVDVWFAARQAWNREVRGQLERRAPELDSEGLLKAAARRAFDGYRGPKPVWRSETWARWSALEKTLPHETKTKWISDWLARDAAAWALEQEAKGIPGLVWTANPAMGLRIAEIAGRPYYGAGDQAAVAIRAEPGTRSVVVSIPAHHKGRNLQAFSANLVVQPPGDVWEQLLGRTHRSMQLRPVVTVEVYRHVRELSEAFDVAVSRAGYVRKTIGADQKLLNARV